MDLVAGDAVAILTAISTDDLAAFADRTRFAAHLSLGPGLDPTWLDRFSEAARSVTGPGEPVDFLDARRERDGPDHLAGRTIERVDPRAEAIARLSDHDAASPASTSSTGYGTLPARKALIRELAGGGRPLPAASGPDIIFAWSLVPEAAQDGPPGASSSTRTPWKTAGGEGRSGPLAGRFGSCRPGQRVGQVRTQATWWNLPFASGGPPRSCHRSAGRARPSTRRRAGRRSGPVMGDLRDRRPGPEDVAVERGAQVAHDQGDVVDQPPVEVGGTGAGGGHRGASTEQVGR